MEEFSLFIIVMSATLSTCLIMFCLLLGLNKIMGEDHDF
jgi:hypothetical protein